jgi:hypothetical protein
MELVDGPLLALRVACRGAHTPEQARLLDTRACERLFSLSWDALDNIWREVTIDGVAAAARSEPHGALTVLHARLRLLDACDMRRARSALEEYASFVAAVDAHILACTPERWVALGREAARISVGAASPSCVRAAQGAAGIASSASQAPDLVASAATASISYGNAPENVQAVSTTFTTGSSSSPSPPNEALGVPRNAVASAVHDVIRESTATSTAQLASSHGGMTPAAGLLLDNGTELATGLIFTLRSACNALAPSKDHLVPLHADYLAVCIQAKRYNLAFELSLEKRNAIDVKATCICASDILCIHYYLAVANIAAKKFAPALQHCRLALAVPSPGISDVAVAAYKKFVVISLLVHGSVPAFVKNSSYPAGRLRIYASEYADLAKPFETGEIDEVRKLVTSNHHVFLRDANIGLVKKLVDAMPRQGVLRLMSSYITLSLDEVMAQLRLPSRHEAEALVLSMIEDGTIRATIDARASVVRFADDVEDSYGGAPDSAALDRHVDFALKCAHLIREFHHSILSDPAYASRKHLERDQQVNGPAGSGMGMEDEDPDFE